MSEFKRILQHVRNDFNNHHIMVLGDFNMPTAMWEINATTCELHIVNHEELPPMEKRFFNITTSYGLTQQNHIPNSRGTFLDLIFSSITLCDIESVPSHYQIGINSAHHTATTFAYNYVEKTQQRNDNRTKSLDYGSTKLSRTKEDLQDTKFAHINNQDIQYYYTNNESKILGKINDFVLTLCKIQNKYTKFQIEKPMNISHPWTKEKMYQLLVSRRKFEKRRFVNNPTPAQKVHSPVLTLRVMLRTITSRGNITTEFWRIIRETQSNFTT